MYSFRREERVITIVAANRDETIFSNPELLNIASRKKVVDVLRRHSLMYWSSIGSLRRSSFL